MPESIKVGGVNQTTKREWQISYICHIQWANKQKYPYQIANPQLTQTALISNLEYPCTPLLSFKLCGTSYCAFLL